MTQRSRIGPLEANDRHRFFITKRPNPASRGVTLALNALVEYCIWSTMAVQWKLETEMAISTPEQPRDRRFQLRATASEETLIKVAAERQGVNVTDFIMRSACESAEQTLSDQTRFVLDEKQWKAFMAALDRPPKDKPRLRRLFTEPHVAKRRP